MNRMRLLAASTVDPWHSIDGYALRVREMLIGLSDEWSITLVSPGPSPTPEELTHLGVDEWSELRLGQPGTVSVIRSSGGHTGEVRQRLQALIEHGRPDAVLLWPGTESALFADRGWPRAVCDRIDSSTLMYLRDLSGLSGFRAILSRLSDVVESIVFERRLLHAASATVVVGEDDARALHRQRRGARIEVIPNGVAATRSLNDCVESPRPTVIFTGVLCYPPNVEAARYFATAVFPGVRARVPDAEFWIVGRDPSDAVRALVETPGIELKENVPDMAAVLGRAWVAVAPMRSGAGIKNKILEAWVLGKPVAMTSLAANGLDVGEELNEGITSSAAEMTSRVCEWLGSEEERRRVGALGVAHVQRRHDWKRAAHALSKLLMGGEAPS